MKFAEVPKFPRKSGVAEGSAVQRARPENIFRGSGLGFEARRADRQTSAQPGRAGNQSPPTLSELP
jgi:hypothetical protein